VSIQSWYSVTVNNYLTLNHSTPRALHYIRSVFTNTILVLLPFGCRQWSVSDILINVCISKQALNTRNIGKIKTVSQFVPVNMKATQLQVKNAKSQKKLVDALSVFFTKKDMASFAVSSLAFFCSERWRKSRYLLLHLKHWLFRDHLAFSVGE